VPDDSFQVQTREDQDDRRSETPFAVNLPVEQCLDAPFRPKILLAEDTLAYAKVIRFGLEAAGFDVTRCANGCEAWELAQDNKFDLVITDNIMPKMTGIDLCRSLRQDSRYAQTPIILLTAYFDPDIDQLRDELQIRVCTKPIKLAELVNIVNAILDGIEAVPC